MADDGAGRPTVMRRGIRRWLIGVIAFAIGFGGSYAAFTAARGASGGSTSEALGTPNLRSYCRDVYGATSTAVKAEPNAYGWRCTLETNGVFATRIIDLTQVCKRQFATETAFAFNAGSNTDERWECRRPVAG